MTARPAMSRGLRCSRRTFHALLAALILTPCVTGGCSDATRRKWRYRSADRNYRDALEAEHADVRRDAVARIAESRYVDAQNAFAVLDAVARTDPVAQIRCVAIRAFTRYNDARPIATVLTILQAKAGSGGALPPDDDVRWEAGRTLVALGQKGHVADDQRATAMELFIQMSDPDSRRDMRITAVEALGLFRDRRVFGPLVAALRTADFAVAERAERSLIALTGVTHDYDADAWEQWLAGTPDPFARAGQIPDVPRPRGPTWWDQQKRAWRRAMRLSETR